MATQLIPEMLNEIIPGPQPTVLRVGGRKKLPSSLCRKSRRRALTHSAKALGLKPVSSQDVATEYIPLVRRMAYQMRGHLPAQVDVNELISEGLLGLVDALQKFDATKRIKFESYARYRIRGAILDGLRNLDPASRDMRRKEKILQQKRQEMEGRLGRGVTEAELADALGCPLEQLYILLRDLQAFTVGSPTVCATDEVPLNLAEFVVEDRTASPFEMCYRSEQQDIMRKLLKTLHEKEQIVLTLYYYGEVPMKDIAMRLGVDQSRVSQLHTAALAKLRRRVGAYLGRVPQYYRVHFQAAHPECSDRSLASSSPT